MRRIFADLEDVGVEGQVGGQDLGLAEVLIEHPSGRYSEGPRCMGRLSTVPIHGRGGRAHHVTIWGLSLSH